MKLSTIAGSNVAPHPNIAQPVAASGQAISGGEAAYTVEAGMYALTALVGYIIGGWLTTATAANVVFACGVNQTILIEVPIGTTDVHLSCVGDGALGKLRKLQA
jgi:hypothetical protein